MDGETKLGLWLITLLLAVLVITLGITHVNLGQEITQLTTERDQMQASRDKWKDMAMDQVDTIVDLRKRLATRAAAGQLFEGVDNDQIHKIEGTLMVWTMEGRVLVVDLLYDPDKPQASTLELDNVEKPNS